MSKRPASMWAFTVENEGSIENAVCDKYYDLFAEDEILIDALDDYRVAEARIHARMRELAALESGAASKESGDE